MDGRMGAGQAANISVLEWQQKFNTAIMWWCWRCTLRTREVWASCTAMLAAFLKRGFATNTRYTALMVLRSPGRSFR